MTGAALPLPWPAPAGAEGWPFRPGATGSERRPLPPGAAGPAADLR
jgi:hypothetical protein